MKTPRIDRNRIQASTISIAVGMLSTLGVWDGWHPAFAGRSAGLLPVGPASQAVKSRPGRSGAQVAHLRPAAAAGGGRYVAQAVDRDNAAGALSLFLLVGVVLGLVFLLGSIVLVRNASRQRAASKQQRSPPTSAGDVWAMHKPPEEDDREEPDAQNDQ